MALDLYDDVIEFDEIQWLRDQCDIVLSLSGYCKSSLGIIKSLQGVEGADFEHEWALQPYADRLSDFVESLSALEARIPNVINLVSFSQVPGGLHPFVPGRLLTAAQAAYFLELRNQNTAAKATEHMEELATATRKDTTAMKWITILTVIYLPANFVAVSPSCRN